MTRRRHALDQPAERAQRRRQVHELRPLQRERAVVLREALGQPQLARHVGPIEVERLEALRPDALHVPAVKELVRDRVEQAHASRRDGAAGADDRAVAMLHPVAAGGGQIVGEERVIAGLVVGVLAVNRAFLADDLLDVLRVTVQLRLGTEMVHGEAKRPRSDGEPADGERAHFRRAVHQVLKVRRGERVARRNRGVAEDREAFAVQLGRDEPAPVHPCGLIERHRHGPLVEATRPHNRRGHVDVRVRRVDREIRAVDAIAVHLVFHGGAAAVAARVPAVRIRSRGLDLTPVRRRDVHVVHVLGEVVQRVPARRRSAHPQLERARSEVWERRLDLHPVMLRLGE